LKITGSIWEENTAQTAERDRTEELAASSACSSSTKMTNVREREGERERERSGSNNYGICLFDWLLHSIGFACLPLDGEKDKIIEEFSELRRHTQFVLSLEKFTFLSLHFQSLSFTSFFFMNKKLSWSMAKKIIDACTLFCVKKL